MLYIMDIQLLLFGQVVYQFTHFILWIYRFYSDENQCTPVLFFIFWVWSNFIEDTRCIYFLWYHLWFWSYCVNFHNCGLFFCVDLFSYLCDGNYFCDKWFFGIQKSRHSVMESITYVMSYIVYKKIESIHMSHLKHVMTYKGRYMTL